MTDTLTVPDVLLQAADLVDAGWVQDNWTDSGCFCLVGAIKRVTGLISENGEWDTYETPDFAARSKVHWDARQAVSNLLSTRGYRHGAINWNDEKGRTQEEVSAVLRETAAAC